MKMLAKNQNLFYFEYNEKIVCRLTLHKYLSLCYIYIVGLTETFAGSHCPLNVPTIQTLNIVVH